MKNKENELIEKFKELEVKLLDLLKIDAVDFSEEEKKSVVKNKLKAYIKKVEKARLVFEEYEQVAKKIEKLSADKKISEDIVALREDLKTDEVEKYVDETLIEQGEVKVVKKKQKNNKAREF